MSEAPSPPTPLQLLSAASEAIARSADLDTVLGTLLGSAAEAVGADAGAVYLQDPDRSALEPFLAIGFEDSALTGLAHAAADPADPVAVTARDLASSITHADGGGAFGAASGCHTVVFRPLVTTRGGIDLPVGVLVVGWRELHELSPDQSDMLAATADLAAVAVDRARLASLVAERSEWFERIAHSDPLTGLANLRTLSRVLELELARAARQGGEVSVAVVDVDDFQALNEAAGHEAGDDVLRSVAAVLAESVRLVDTVARRGGDEFVIVAPGSAGLTVARRIMSAVAAVPPVGGRPVSVSIGLARYPTDGGTADELVTAAVAALDQARVDGRTGIAEATAEPA